MDLNNVKIKIIGHAKTGKTTIAYLIHRTLSEYGIGVDDQSNGFNNPQNLLAITLDSPTGSIVQRAYATGQKTRVQLEEIQSADEPREDETSSSNDTPIDTLQKERAQLVGRINKIDNAIGAWQEICSHKYKDGTSAVRCIWEDSCKKNYKCQVCGKVYSQQK